MWNLLNQKHNGKTKVDIKDSFFCGDAAGRKDAKHKDFSDTDLKFALNVGIQFKTPENLFLGEKEKAQAYFKNGQYVIYSEKSTLRIQKI